MIVERFVKQLAAAENRFEHNQAVRRSRTEELDKLREAEPQPVDVSRIDAPSRIARRVLELSRDAQTSEALLTASFTPGQTGEAKPPALNVLERLIGQNDLLSADFLAAGVRASRTVGRVVVRSGGTVLGFGSGFLVSPRLILTNNHVLESPEIADDSIIQFDFIETLSGQQLTPDEFALVPRDFFETDERLDFTLVAIEPENSNGRRAGSRGWSRLIGASGKAIVGERVNVLQHPNGERQQLALRQNQIVDVVEDFLHYIADTQQGSSGSPLFNDQWQLAALHHSGVPARDGAGHILLINGDRWSRTREDIDRIRWIANEGIRISSIVAELRERIDDLSSAKRDLLDQAFSAPPVDASSTERSRTTPDLAKFENGRVTWTIPVEFSVEVPTFRATGRPSESAPRRKRPAQRKSREQLLDEFSQRNINRARAAYERHKNDEYYNEQEDEQRNIDYYADIDDALVGDELFDALRDLLRATHANQLNYNTARYEHLYPFVDLREDRTLASIYSGKPVDFEDIIVREALIEAQHELALQEFMMKEGAFDEAAVDAFRFALESQDPFNCEHIVVQSWFGHKNPMKSDLHHLTTCEPDCNSSRNDNAYFEFDPDAPDFDDECGQVDRDASRFEPAQGKGIVARATLYYLLRYPKTINADRAMKADRLPIILNWHSEEPVTLFERHRNAEIQRVQGNRNPLIDFPDWADVIPFERGLP